MKKAVLPIMIILLVAAFVGAAIMDQQKHRHELEYGKAGCQLTLSELVERAEEHKLCSIRQFEDHHVDWVIDDLKVANTGEFYYTKYRNWDVAVFLKKDEDCQCVPEHKLFQHLRVEGKLRSVDSYKLIIGNATVTETDESMNAEAND